MNTALLLLTVLSLRGDLAHPRYPIRASAEARIGRMDDRVEPAVRRLLTDPDPHVADWAHRELARREERQVQARADAFMRELDEVNPKDPALNRGIQNSDDYVRCWTNLLHDDPRMALRWAARAHTENPDAMAEYNLAEFLRVFGVDQPDGPLPVQPAQGWLDYYPFGFWVVRSVWEARWAPDERLVVQPRVVGGP